MLRAPRTAVLTLLLSASPIVALSQPAEISVRVQGVTGPAFNDCVNNLDGLIDPSFRYRLILSAKSDAVQTGATLGIVIYSPDNSLTAATVGNVVLAPEWASGANYWTIGDALNTLIDGILPEMVLTGGIGIPGSLPGFQSAVFEDFLTIDIETNGDGIICIDSAFVPPIGDWLMAPDGPPVWSGGGGDLTVGGTSPTAFCLTSTSLGGGAPCFTVCPAAMMVRLGATLNYFVSIDPSAFNLTSSTTGAGVLTFDSSGFVMYVTDSSDVGNSVIIDIGMTLLVQSFPCPEADTIVCNCVTHVTVTTPALNCCDTPGDADHNGAVNIADVTFLIARIFSGGPIPFCVNEADVNADGKINISDITFLIARIFAGGPAPVCGTVL